MSEIQTELSVLLIFELTAAATTPPSRTVTLAPGKNTREVALVDEAAQLSNIGKLVDRVV